MTRVAIIDPDLPGQQTIRLTDIPEQGGLEALQEAVGGYIEHVTLARGVAGMYVHDEGLLIDLPVNPLASYLYATVGGRTPICGPAVLVGGPDAEGRDLDVPMQLVDILARQGVTVVGP